MTKKIHVKAHTRRKSPAAVKFPRPTQPVARTSGKATDVSHQYGKKP